MGILNSELDCERKKNASLEDRIAELESSLLRSQAEVDRLRAALERLIIATKGYSIPPHEVAAAIKVLEETVSE